MPEPKSMHPHPRPPHRALPPSPFAGWRRILMFVGLVGLTFVACLLAAQVWQPHPSPVVQKSAPDAPVVNSQVPPLPSPMMPPDTTPSPRIPQAQPSPSRPVAIAPQPPQPNSTPQTSDQLPSQSTTADPQPSSQPRAKMEFSPTIFAKVDLSSAALLAPNAARSVMEATPPTEDQANRGADPDGSPSSRATDSVATFVAPSSYQGKVVRNVAVAATDKVIALTFDDGPWPNYTPQVLDILKQHQIKATFFWIGLHLELHSKIAKRVVAEGHSIGNHTWHHRYHPATPTEAANEIEHTAKLMQTLTGVKTTLFRPPGGRLDNGLADYAEKKKQTVVLWSVMPADTNLGISAQTIANRVLATAKPGGIVLLHDGGGDRKHTVQALPQIIAGLEKQGYRFVTIPELLQRPTASPTSPTTASTTKLS